MDIATIIGVISGWAVILWAILMGSGPGVFLDIPSIMITIGGTITATLVNFPLSKVVGVFAVVKKAFLYKLPSPTAEIERMTRLARVARAEGLLALENSLDETKDPFLQKSIQLVVDGTDPEIFRDVLTTEVEQIRARHQTGKSVLDFMGAAAPAFGMIGTLIGLVQMLTNMTDASAIGAGMAVALITTFYGSLVANMVCIPMAGKLDLRSKQEMMSKQLIIEGMAAIQAGLNPRLVEEKLKAFLEPKQRSRMERMKKAA